MADGYGGLQAQKRLVGIFWDIENCAVPKSKAASGVVNHIRSSFIVNRLNHREYEFLVACDVSKMRNGMVEDLNRAGGVTVAHVSGTNKNAADEKIRESMRRFVDTHAFSNSTAPPPTLVLISGDIDFVNDLRGYQTRLGCTIILIHNATCSPQFKVGWNELYAFKDFCAAVPDTEMSNGNIEQTKAGPNPGNVKQDRNKQQQQGAPQPKAQGPGNARQGGPKPNQGKNFPGPRPNGPNQSGTGRGQQPPQVPNNRGPRGPAPGFQNGPRQPGPGFQNGPRQPGLEFQNGPRQPGPGPKNASLSGAMNNMNIGKPATGPNNSNPNQKPPPECILMVSGLPGKLDFQILKAHLQEHANQVNGKVKYVKNGQAFISFKQKADANRAITLFHGFQIYDKKLNVTVVNSIPFENPKPQKAAGPAANTVQSKPAANAQNSAGRGQGQNQAPKQMPGQATPSPPFDSQLAGYLGQFAGAAIRQMNEGDGASGKQKKNHVKPANDPNCTIM